ncbi:peptidoglycan recognition protein family protein [Nocardia asiatica]|uniref:peptidoglycan recognition protein family protein n=1 Tax=Nocardia asiatica TaxID=209252 RepID=UPI002454A3FD|nr:N-acetylmuramoyl-L-alanine amidase [Nocardia asiatica]
MSWYGDPTFLADVLRAEGLKVIEHDGWRSRGHGDFSNVRGVLCHHTAGGGPNDWAIVQNGRSDLPGPLAQLVLERDGTFRVIAAGVCWHAGRGSWPGWPTDNANYCVIGIEAVNDGRGQEWPAVQLDAYKRGCAAILRFLGRTADDCVGHKEYSSEGKIDPFGIDMDAFRRDVQEIIDNGGSEMPALEETFTNYKGDTVTVGTALFYLDKYVNEIREQLGGPTPFKGWKQLGDKTVVDSLADAHRKIDVLTDLISKLVGKSAA